MELDLSKTKKVYFVGIGGIGISAIARMMFLEGKEVSGSDLSGSEITEELESLGIKIIIGQSFDFIPKDTDLIIYSIAIPNYDSKLFEQIKNSGIPYKSYPEMLGIVTKNKYTIAVAGTHGKTTVTAMIAKILIDAKMDPTVIVGSLLKEYKSNLIVGKSEYFVVEACEYKRSFLNIKPTLLVITNIEEDHLDYYKDINDIKNAFAELSNQSDNVIKDYTKYLEKVPKLLVPGEHNRMNGAAALAVADFLHIKLDDAQKSLAQFSGTWRRLEKRGETKEGTIIYDDYAHHPTEIHASLSALKETYPDNKITIVFQPHMYSRTKAFFRDFIKELKEVEELYILPIFYAREAKDESVSSEILAKEINKIGGNARNFSDFESAEAYLRSKEWGKKDVFVTMGAGEAYKVADTIFKF